MIDQLDLQIVTWVFDNLDELEWFEGSTGGCIARVNGVGINISVAGISISDGFKSCRVVLPKLPKKLMDVDDHYQKKVHEMIKAISTEATRQVIERAEDPNHARKIKDELLKKLTGVW